MRVLFCVSDYPAHYFPLVPLAWALQSAGHEVRVACSPREVGPVSAAGLVPVPILGGPDMMERGRIYHYFAALKSGPGRLGMPLHPVTGQVLERLTDFDWPAYKRHRRDANVEAVDRSLDDAVSYARWWRPDLVVHDLLNLEGVLVGQVTKVPAVCHLWGPVGTAEDRPGVQLVPADHTGAFTRHVVAPMSAALLRYAVTPGPVAPPTSAARMPVRFVPYNGPGSVTLPPAARPRVCVVWGNSLAGLLGPRSFLLPTILSALADLDVDVVATRDPHASVGPVPPNVQLLAGCPLRLLLPSCDAVVYHGGAGCGMTAVACGTPQLALPFTPEQDTNAQRITAVGVGLVHDGATVSPSTVRSAVLSLLGEPSFAAAARRLQAQNSALPAPAALVQDLVALA